MRKKSSKDVNMFNFDIKPRSGIAGAAFIFLSMCWWQTSAYASPEGDACVIDVDCQTCASSSYSFRQWKGICIEGVCDCVPDEDQLLEGCGSEPGDVNNDGNVSILDVVGIVQFVLGNGAIECALNGEVSCDLSLSILDVVKIVNAILGNDTLESCFAVGCGGDAAVECDDCILHAGVCWAGPANIYCCDEVPYFMGYSGECWTDITYNGSLSEGSFCSYDMCEMHGEFTEDPDEEIPNNGIDDDCNPETSDVQEEEEVVPECGEPGFIFPSDEHSDRDCIPDEIDNCPQTFNPAQLDTDNNGVGDRCETRICSGMHFNGVCDDPSALNYCGDVSECDNPFDTSCESEVEDPDCMPYNWVPSDCHGCIYPAGECGCSGNYVVAPDNYYVGVSYQACFAGAYTGEGEGFFNETYDAYCAELDGSGASPPETNECNTNGDCPAERPTCVTLPPATGPVNVCMNTECTCAPQGSNPYNTQEPVCSCTWTSFCHDCDGMCHPGDFSNCAHDSNLRAACIDHCNDAWAGNNSAQAQEACNNSLGPMESVQCSGLE